MTEFEALARTFEKLSAKVVLAANKAGADTVRDARAWAIYFSSGTTSTAQLVRLGHPYGHGFARFIASDTRAFGKMIVRGPIPYGDASIINTQTGRFRDDWITYVAAVGIQSAKGLITYGVKNVDPIASYLQFGTVRMIARPLDKGLRTYMDQVYAKRLVEEVVPIFRYAFA